METLKALLLCPGPSLARFAPGPGELAMKLVVCVNRAALKFPCDAWAALDWTIVKAHGHDVQGSPVLITSGDTPRLLDRVGVKWRGQEVFPADLFAYVPHVVNYVLFSATTGLVFAAMRGAKEIDIYGCDWQGTLDYDGVTGGQTRTPFRWDSEKLIWAATLEALKAKGIEVRLHQA